MNEKVDVYKLLRTMTMDEKIGQLMQLLPTFFSADKEADITGPLGDLNMDEEVIWRSGSVIGVTNAEDMIDIQKNYLEKSSKKIPLMFMLDVIHGFKTIFPITLAIGCSWDLEAAKRSAQIAAKEAALSGVQVTFAPMADLVRDPRWGRVMESTGEDHFLNGLFAAAFVIGFQGKMDEVTNIAACIKHFAAYGAAEGGRDYNSVDMSDRTLREYYLPAYKAAIDAGCEMVMSSFNIVHGIPSTGNKYLMREILRGEWGFDGVVVSDFASVSELMKHGVAENGREAAKLAIEAGIDIEMMTSNYVNNLKKLIEEEEISCKLLDDAVLRILRLKEKLGLFENPYRAADPKEAERICLCDDHRKEARDIAAKSIVLLKNNGILPLSKEKKLAVIGPFAENHRLLGGWRALGKEEETITLSSGISNKIGERNVIVEKGCEIEGNDESGFKKAIAAAKKADIIILALGEDQDMSGEAASKAFIKLPGSQEKLAEEVLKLHKPTVVVLFNGRPLEMTRLTDIAPAVLEAWFPGTEGGNAVADILFGDINPSARLTMSFPYTEGQIPVYYNCYNTGRPQSEGKEGDHFLSQYLDIPNEPLYPFGYGLSYSDFLYKDININGHTLEKGGTLIASINVKNTGKMSGTETVQLYIRDLVGNTVRPIKELKGFKRITLLPGEEQRVEFEITCEMLKYHDFKGNYQAEPGEFVVMIGCNSRNVDAVKFRMEL